MTEEKEYFKETENELLHSELMQKLVVSLTEEKGISTIGFSEEEITKLGCDLSDAWQEGKTKIDQSDYLIDKFGTDEQKKDYNEWKLSQ